jgi:hypothetical protein
MLGHVLHQPCRIAEAKDEQSGGHRIERARVTDFALMSDSAGFGDHVVTRPALRLIDEQDAM